MISFNNCQNNHKVTGATLEEQSICKKDLQKLFENTYYAHAHKANSCVLCHTGGGLSPYPFADDDINLAYQQFNLVGRATMEAVAVDPAHSKDKNVTGPAQQQAFDTLKIFWDQGEAEYNTCMTAQAPSVGDLKQTTGTVFTNIYFSDNLTQEYIWDLSSPINLQRGTPILAKFGMSVRIYYVSGVAKGYTFSNPKVFAQTGEDEIVVESLYVLVNDRVITDLPTFASATGYTRGIDGLINGGNQNTLVQGTFTVNLDKISNQDKISLVAGRMYARPRTDNPPNPPNPTLAATNLFSRNGNITFTIGGDNTARRWCLTSSPTRPTNALSACPGVPANTMNTLNGWYTSRPGTNNYNLTIHYPSLVDQQTYPLYLWIADSNLKINATAPSLTFTYDPTPPVAPTIASLNGGGANANAQVTTISLTHPDEATTTLDWCVREGGTNDNLGNANGCTFVRTKPTLVSLTAGGPRQIRAFVRDPAGNTSTASVASTVNNPNGIINYTQLYIETGTARSVMNARCLSCHDSATSNTAAKAALEMNADLAFGYVNAVADKAKILNVVRYGCTDASANNCTPNIATGKAHTGGATVQSPFERMMIELWLGQGTPAAN